MRQHRMQPVRQAGWRLLLILFVIAGMLLTGCQNDNEANAKPKQEASQQKSPKEKPVEDGDGAVASKGTVKMEDFDGRAVFLYLPPGYDQTEDRYPVVYMHDGQNVFKVETSGYGKEWKVDEVLDQYIAEGKMQPVIVAALAHANDRRSLEYVPFSDPEANSDPVAAEQFTNYFIHDFVPYIDTNYRTIADRDHRMIMGSSFGGLQAIWMGYHHPEVFSAIGAVSPSTWVEQGRLFKEMAKKKPEDKPDVKIWLDMGAKEGMPIDALINSLRAIGFETGQDLFYMMDEQGVHDENAWAKRVHSPLLMFGGQEPAQNAVSLEVNDFMTTYGPDGSYVRINPVVTMDNGMTFTAWDFAEYKVLNPEAGAVDETGKVTFLKPQPLEVEVNCGGVTKIHTVDSAPYMKLVKETVEQTVYESKGKEVKIFLAKSEEKLNLEAGLIEEEIRAVEGSGLFKILEVQPEFITIVYNE